jgi:hypothetical protein
LIAHRARAGALPLTLPSLVTSLSLLDVRAVDSGATIEASRRLRRGHWCATLQKKACSSRAATTTDERRAAIANSLPTPRLDATARRARIRTPHFFSLVGLNKCRARFLDLYVLTSASSLLGRARLAPQPSFSWQTAGHPNLPQYPRSAYPDHPQRSRALFFPRTTLFPASRGRTHIPRSHSRETTPQLDW